MLCLVTGNIASKCGVTYLVYTVCIINTVYYANNVDNVDKVSDTTHCYYNRYYCYYCCYCCYKLLPQLTVGLCLECCSDATAQLQQLG